MISTPEEARLLLNKWMSEAVRVVAFVSATSIPADFVVRLEGFVSTVEENTGTVCFESGDNFIMFRLDGEIQYQESFQIGGTLPQVLARERQPWAVSLCLGYQGSTLLFCTNV